MGVRDEGPSDREIEMGLYLAAWQHRKYQNCRCRISQLDNKEQRNMDRQVSVIEDSQAVIRNQVKQLADSNKELRIQLKTLEAITAKRRREGEELEHKINHQAGIIAQLESQVENLRKCADTAVKDGRYWANAFLELKKNANTSKGNSGTANAGDACQNCGADEAGKAPAVQDANLTDWQGEAEPAKTDVDITHDITLGKQDGRPVFQIINTEIIIPNGTPANRLNEIADKQSTSFRRAMFKAFFGGADVF